MNKSGNSGQHKLSTWGKVDAKEATHNCRALDLSPVRITRFNLPLMTAANGKTFGFERCPQLLTAVFDLPIDMNLLTAQAARAKRAPVIFVISKAYP